MDQFKNNIKDLGREKFLTFLEKKSREVRGSTIEIHMKAPETRLASSLSAVEICTVLYFGGLVKNFPKTPLSDERDRFVISKGHGSIAMYPILAEFGFFDKKELDTVCSEGSFLGGIPDPIIPGYETVNGSLGHGIGVAAGIALALKAKKSDRHVYVLVGDGELYEGSNWEAIMFASHHNLNNLTLIIDNNKVSMLGYCKDIVKNESFAEKFEAFGWSALSVDGHSVEDLYDCLTENRNNTGSGPTVIVADTIKGKGVPGLEKSSLSHVISVPNSQLEEAINNLQLTES